jgi:hypothetical protein
MIKARYWVALVICGAVAYQCLRPEEDVVEQIDVNAHICTAAKPREVEMALAEKGLTVTIDTRVNDAKVIEVPEAQKDTALSELQNLQERHPDWGIKIRTDKFISPKKP